MTKAEMVKKLSETWGETSNRAAADKLDSFVEFIIKTVKKEKELRIPNLGTFQIRHSKRRQGNNPQTGDPMTIPARKRVAFTAAKVFKDSVQSPAKKTAAKKTAAKKTSAKKTAAKKTARKKKQA